MIAYKYRSGRGPKDCDGNDIFERDIKLLSQDSIYIPTVEQLNDPSEALFDDSIFKMQMSLFKPFVTSDAFDRVKLALDDLYKKVRSSGIYSLSKDPLNELMWAYYANGHNGYAIMFDTDVLAKSFENVKYGGMYEFDVSYSSKLPRFDISKIDKNIGDVLTVFVGNKSKSWQHEVEHRLIFEQGSRSLKIDYRAIKGFVFGCRMPQDDIDYVMRMFSGRDLAYYQIARDDHSYNLSRIKIEDKYSTDVKYCPNKVEYDIEELLENDQFIEGVGYKYRNFVEQALDEVCHEPFVTGISHIVVTDDERYPHILIWTNYDQDGAYKKMRKFEYDVINSEIVKVEV